MYINGQIDSNIMSFNGWHQMVLSPIAHYLPQSAKMQTRPFGISNNDKRAEALIAFHGAIENMMNSPNPLRTERGEFYVRRLYGLETGEDFVMRDTSLWGGDGIKIAVDNDLSGQELSRIFGEGQWVVYQTSIQKHFMDGHEVRPSKDGQTMRRLWSV